MNTKFSIIIISYNRPTETLECIKSINNFCSKELIGEIIIINNNSDVDYEIFYKSLKKIDLKIIYKKLDQNLGVAGGRNYGIRISKHNKLFFIDDDAEVKNDILAIADNIFKSNKNHHVLAVQSLNFYNKKININEFPCHDKSKIDQNSFETSHFIGVGHFIKKEVFEKCGLYPENFMYGMEEYDLAYRCLINEFKIFYYSNLIVYHKKSQDGRLPSNEVGLRLAINKIVVAYKFLPYNYFITHLILWTLKYLISQRFKNIINYFQSLNRRLNELNRESYPKITKEQLHKIMKLGNKVLY